MTHLEEIRKNHGKTSAYLGDPFHKLTDWFIATGWIYFSL